MSYSASDSNSPFFTKIYSPIALPHFLIITFFIIRGPLLIKIVVSSDTYTYMPYLNWQCIEFEKTGVI